MYAPLALAQVFSSFKAVLFQKFAPLKYREDDPQWYIELYRGLKLRACALCIKRGGGTISKKHVSFPRKELLACLLHLIKKYGDGTGYEERAVLAMLFHAVGRGSEQASLREDGIVKPTLSYSST
jgi:hypothetical protein